jgi:hypothetical protein
MGELPSLGNGTFARLIEISKPALRPRRNLADPEFTAVLQALSQSRLLSGPSFGSTHKERKGRIERVA